jgi:hypothetical protein
MRHFAKMFQSRIPTRTAIFRGPIYKKKQVVCNIMQRKISYPVLFIVCAALIGGGVAAIVMALSKNEEGKPRFQMIAQGTLTSLGFALSVLGLVVLVMGHRHIKAHKE